jgi:histidinol-phosphatase (PHP family)
MIDYHVHTTLCNHVTGSMTAFAGRAVEIGIEEICFLDHLTLRAAEPALSMTPGEVPLYYHGVRSLQERFRGKIDIKVGLEIDFNPEEVAHFRKIVETFDFDLIGGSVHYLDGLDIVTGRSPWRSGNLDPDMIWSRYIEVLEEMLDHDYFDVICHFDLVKKYGPRPTRSFAAEFDRVLRKVREKDVALELNTSGYDYPIGEPFPSPELIETCSRLGIPVTLSSDAHRPGEVGRHRDEALALLKNAGFRNVATFTRRRRSMKKIPERDR